MFLKGRTAKVTLVAGGGVGGGGLKARSIAITSIETSPSQSAIWSEGLGLGFSCFGSVEGRTGATTAGFDPEESASTSGSSGSSCASLLCFCNHQASKSDL